MQDPVGPNLAHPGRAAFDQLAAERAALDPLTIAAYNLEATHAVATARAISVRLQPYRAALATLPLTDLGLLDQLTVYADALEFVHATLTSRAERVRQLPELAAEAYPLRALLLAFGDVLALKGRMPGDVLARLRQGSGYRDLIEDLNALLVLYSDRPEVLGSGGPVGVEDLERAKQLARQLSDQLGVDNDLNLSQDELVQERQKLAHLLNRAQRELRRALDYLRFHEGDAAALVPSLYLGGFSGRPRQDAPAPVAAPPANPDDSPFSDDAG